MPKGKAGAAAAIWDWQHDESLSDKSRTTVKITARRQRRQGWLKSGITMTLAVFLWFLGLKIMAIIAGSLGLIVLITASIAPANSLLSALNRGSDRLGRWLSNLISWILLGTVYMIFFMPFRYLFRRGKRDTLKRWFETEAESYWEKCEDDRLAKGSRNKQF